MVRRNIYKHLLFIKIIKQSFITEAEAKMLSISDGPTPINGTTDKLNYRNSFAGKKNKEMLNIDV